MIGKNIKRFDIGQPSEKSSEPGQILLFVRKAGNYDMPDPYGGILLCQITGEGENGSVIMSGNLFVYVRPDMLDVQHHQISDGKYALKPVSSLFAAVKGNP